MIQLRKPARSEGQNLRHATAAQISASPRAPLSLPRPPRPPEPRPFPLVATIAPVVGTVVLWVLTHSAYVLLFAMLGPLVAVASLGDGALQGRRTRARERRRFAADVAAARAEITRAHVAERSSLAATHRDLRALLDSPARDPERWRASLDSELPVIVGTGTRTSQLAFDSAAASSKERDEFTAELDALCAAAASLTEAPIVVDARLGIGVSGAPALRAAVARGIVLQLANLLSPLTHELIVGERQDRDWMAGLPHPIVPSGAPGAVVFRRRDDAGAAGPSRDTAIVAVARSVEGLPPDCRVVLNVTGASAARLLPRPRDVTHDLVSPEFVSREQARAFSAVLGGAAEARGVGGRAGVLPELLPFSSLYPPGTEAAPAETVAADSTPDSASSLDGRRSLACTPVATAAGPVTIDLVRDGPHAIIGGTTGSGKSELLVSWVLALAATHPPSAVTFLLVDFKGGSSFTAVQQLPHSVGLITDLDERSAGRALTSLRAELRHRERELAEAGVRSIDQLPSQHPLARLVIVVDEFAAMVQDFPELHELFADIAARGRSLGVHLILCTQRPAGVVRDAILANCTLRFSLRVTSAGDSSAVIGSPAAAELPRLPLGRALFCLSGEDPLAVQVALAGEADSDRVSHRWPTIAARPAPRRPWCDPLPAAIPLDSLVASETDREPEVDDTVFGLLDLPQEQRLGLASYNPRRDGNLLVVGGHRSGKSGMLAVLLANNRIPTLAVPRDLEGAWDTLTGQLAAVRGGEAVPRLLLIDDIDTLLGGYPDDYAQALTETVTALLREGGRVGTHLVVTARRLGQGLHSVAALCDSRLILRLPDRQEHLLAGGESADFDAGLQPGGGHWRGNRVQIALAAADARSPDIVAASATTDPDWRQWPGILVVAAHPAELLRRLRADPEPQGAMIAARGILADWDVTRLEARTPADPTLSLSSPARRRMLTADPEAWQAQWSLFAALRTSMPILFDGCGTADFRTLSRQRGLPPPIAPGSPAVWLLAPDGTVQRALPPWAPVEGHGAAPACAPSG